MLNKAYAVRQLKGESRWLLKRQSVIRQWKSAEVLLILFDEKISSYIKNDKEYIRSSSYSGNPTGFIMVRWAF